MKKGLEILKEDGMAAVTTEVAQLNTLNVLEPHHPEDIPLEQKQKALWYLMFLQQKKCGRIKAQGCVDGQPQRAYMSKEETSSPNVAIKSLMITCSIDEMESRNWLLLTFWVRSCRRNKREMFRCGWKE